MKLFENFINNRLGKLVWLLLIWFFTYITQNVLILVFVTAVMAWLAITSDKEFNHSEHKKIWRLFSILLPAVTYLIFFLKVEKNFLINKNVATIFLAGNVVFLILTLYFSYSIYNQTILEKTYIVSHTKLTDIEAEIDKIPFVERDNLSDKSLFITYLSAYQKQAKAANELISASQELRSAIFYKYVPEYNKAMSTYITHSQNYIKKVETDIQWAKEGTYEPLNVNKIDDLLSKSNKENIVLQSSLKEVNKEAQGLEKRKLIGATITSRAVGFAGLFGVTLLIYELSAFIFSIKDKKRLRSLGWFLLGIFNIIAFLILIYSIPFN